MEQNTLIIVIAVVLIAVGVVRRLRSGSSIASTDEISALIKEGARVIDVRTPAEFGTNHHPRAENIPLSEIASRASEIDGEVPIVLYCNSGNRSGQAISLLSKKVSAPLTNGGGLGNMPR